LRKDSKLSVTISAELIQKYNIPASMSTSHPTVPIRENKVAGKAIESERNVVSWYAEN
jgi:hypothetical protein